MSQQILTELALSGAATVFESSEDRQTIMAALGVGTQLGVVLPYSRGQESDADLMGLDIMARAGYVPTEAVELWQRMQQAQQGAATPEFLSTHPDSESRIEELRGAMSEAMSIYRSTSPQYGEGQPAPRT